MNEMLNWFKNKLSELESQFLEEYRKKYPKLTEKSPAKMSKRQMLCLKDDERLKRDEVEQLIIDLELPNIILELFQLKTQTLDLNNYYGPPSEFFLMTKKEQDFYNVDAIKPLLSDSDFYTIYAYDIANKGFLAYHIESPEITDDRFRWEGIFINDILQWWEAETPDEIIVQRCQVLGINNIEEILGSMNNDLDNSNYQNILKWRKMVIDKYDLRIKCKK